VSTSNLPTAKRKKQPSDTLNQAQVDGRKTFYTHPVANWGLRTEYDYIFGGTVSAYGLAARCWIGSTANSLGKADFAGSILVFALSSPATTRAKTYRRFDFIRISADTGKPAASQLCVRAASGSAKQLACRLPQNQGVFCAYGESDRIPRWPATGNLLTLVKAFLNLGSTCGSHRPTEPRRQAKP